MRIISLENLLYAWREFKRGKTNKSDVLKFGFGLEENLFLLHQDLVAGRYQPEPYESFFVCDPKLRHIHKATVRDRVLHQAVFRVLYHFFDRHFIYDSYSCRFKKGTHAGVRRLDVLARKLTSNYQAVGYALKCDVRKFFDHIDHQVLLSLIQRVVPNPEIGRLVATVVRSFQIEPGRGLPLGNVTSQLFANIYLNGLDQFVKHELKIKYYLRYCDDFLILDPNREKLLALVPTIENFLARNLKLNLHPQKIILRKITQGVDWLGYVVLPHYAVLRPRTKRRILRKLRAGEINEKNLPSYLGMLKHCHGRKIEKMLGCWRYGCQPARIRNPQILGGK